MEEDPPMTVARLAVLLDRSVKTIANQMSDVRAGRTQQGEKLPLFYETNGRIYFHGPRAWVRESHEDGRKRAIAAVLDRLRQGDSGEPSLPGAHGPAC